MIKVSSLFSIVMGAALITTWVVLFLTGSVRELETPVRLALLLAAEFLTALALISGGWGALTGAKWGLTVHLISLGMLLYCAVLTCGEMGQAGNLPAAIFFAIIAIVTLALGAYWITQSPARRLV